jgi:hypothetical protein
VKLPLVLPAVLIVTLCGLPLAPSAAAASAPAYGTIWTANLAANSISAYARGATGAATPRATIVGPATGLSSPTGVAVDPKGDVFVSDAGNNSVTEYTATATDDAAPIATIAGARTGLDAPSSISYGFGLIWVSDPASNLVEAFSAGSSGNILPAETISGAKTKLDHPTTVSAEQGDGDGIWVANTPVSGAASVDSYGGSGDIAPDSRIAGAKTGLVSPSAIVVVDFETILVADRTSNAISTFDPFDSISSSSNLAPDSTIKGGKTGLNAPAALALDATGDVLAANSGTHTVTRYAATAHGDAAPKSTLSSDGADTAPDAVAVFAAAPGKPAGIKAVGHDKSVRVTWKAPVQTGGGISEYDVIAFPLPKHPSGVVFSAGNVLTTNKTSITLHHLTNGTTYGIEVDAVNSVGESFAEGRLPTVVPLGPATAPRGVTAAPGAGQLSTFWAAPVNNGGRRITHYRVEYGTCSPAARTCHFRSRLVGHARRSVTIKGLSPGHYKVRVLAHTSRGDGAASKVVATTVH